MNRWTLTFHGHRQLKATDKSAAILWLLFSLVSEKDGKTGARLGQDHIFWTEVTLSRDLAERPGWKELSDEDVRKAMFRAAQESIQEVGRKLRQTPLFWTPQSPLAGGPPWDLASVRFPAPHAITFEIADDGSASGQGAREGAGLGA
jgi:hypothetical protein